MGKKANDTFAFDLDNRLDDFFSDSSTPQPKPHAEDTLPTSPDNPLQDLKSTILAIDWEITEAAMQSLQMQVDALLPRFEADKASRTLLKILKSLGKYVNAHKSNAHPDAIMQVMSAYTALENVVTDKGLSGEAKNDIVVDAVRQFKRLKAEITGSNSARATGGGSKRLKSSGKPDMAAVLAAIEALKTQTLAELEAIRAELKRLGARK
jgi:hypothetical protein